MELTYNYGDESYDIGTKFGHFAIETKDTFKLVEDIQAKGDYITQKPGPTPEPLCRILLQVGEHVISFMSPLLFLY